MSYPNLDAERARCGMTKDALARYLGVAPKTLYNWEHSTNIPLWALEKLRALFNCTLDYLTVHEDKEEKCER